VYEVRAYLEDQGCGCLRLNAHKGRARPTLQTKHSSLHGICQAQEERFPDDLFDLLASSRPLHTGLFIGSVRHCTHRADLSSDPLNISLTGGLGNQARIDLSFRFSILQSYFTFDDPLLYFKRHDQPDGRTDSWSI
jgi:hypothetical protein